MRRQLLILQVKILSLSSSNLQYSSFFYEIVLHNKRVIIRLLFQATKGYHISLSFPERISFHFKKQTLLVWKKEFLFFIFYLSFFIFFLSHLCCRHCSSHQHPCHTSISRLKDCWTVVEDYTAIEDHRCYCRRNCRRSKIRLF